MGDDPDSSSSSVSVDSGHAKGGGEIRAPYTVAFFVDWGSCSTHDLIATVKYVERSIEVAKNWHALGSTRLRVADRLRSRVDPISIARLEALSPIVSLREIMVCPTDCPAQAFNRMTLHTFEEIFVFLRAGAIISPTALSALLTLFQQPEVSIVGMRRLPMAAVPHVGAEKGFASLYADEICGAVRAHVFHDLQGFNCEFFGHDLFPVDFGWRARLAGRGIYYDCDINYFFNPQLEDGVSRDRRLGELAILLHMWMGPEVAQDFSERCADEGNAKAVGHFQYLRNLNALPARKADAEKVANFDGFIQL